MSDDKAKHKILPPSKFGLVQITRQRVRPEVNIKTREEDPNNEKAKLKRQFKSLIKLLRSRTHFKNPQKSCA
jgi:ribonuclease G